MGSVLAHYPLIPAMGFQLLFIMGSVDFCVKNIVHGTRFMDYMQEYANNLINIAPVFAGLIAVLELTFVIAMALSPSAQPSNTPAEIDKNQKMEQNIQSVFEQFNRDLDDIQNKYLPEDYEGEIPAGNYEEAFAQVLQKLETLRVTVLQMLAEPAGLPNEQNLAIE